MPHCVPSISLGKTHKDPSAIFVFIVYLSLFWFKCKFRTQGSVRFDSLSRPWFRRMRVNGNRSLVPILTDGGRHDLGLPHII
jgi:hypothetical protein